MATGAESAAREGRAAKVERAVDRIAASRAASIVIVIAGALACFLPGFTTLPLLDGDEPGFVVAAREMIATGDYASVRLQTADAETDPRGPYWIQALAAGAFVNPPVWIYRLPSLIGAVAACLLTWWTVLAFGRLRAALLAGLFVAGAGVLGLQARLATADAILVASVMLSAGALARVWLTPRQGSDIPAALFWTGLGLGILAKGIVAPAMIAAATLVLVVERGDGRWLMRLKPIPGLAWLLVILSPWLVSVALTLVQGADGGPTAEFLSRIGARFALDAPPGTYTLLVPLLAGPAVTYLFLSLVWTLGNLRQPLVLFSLALGGPLWFGAELVTAKVPQNIVPAVPAIAMLAAIAVDRGTARITGWISWFYSLGPLVWPPMIAVAVPIAFFLLEGHVPWLSLPPLVIAAALGPIAWVWLRQERLVASAAMSVATVIFIYVGVFGVVLPGFTSLRLAERVAAWPIPCGGAEYAVAGHPEESMVFALGRGTRIVDAWTAADFLNTSGCRIAVVDRSVITSFRQRADDLGLGVVDIGRIEGFNPRRMRAVELHLFLAEGGTE